MTTRIAYQSFPNQSTPMLDEDNTVTLAWYRLIHALYKRVGFETPGWGVTQVDTPALGGIIGKNVEICVKLEDPISKLYSLHIFDQVTGAEYVLQAPIYMNLV